MASINTSNTSAAKLAKTRPGSFDSLHLLTFERFPGDDNIYEIPSVPHAPLSWTPDWLIPYRMRVRSDEQTASQGAVHFFLDDYRFETVWTRPRRALSALRPYPTLLTPDFSLYTDWPLALQIWNIYRTRWLGAWWSTEGFRVIPTISWSDPASYQFCFCGIALHSLIAISTVGVRQSDRWLFEKGYREMVQRLQPCRVLCYGSIELLRNARLEGLVEIQSYPPYWNGIRRARALGRD